MPEGDKTAVSVSNVRAFHCSDESCDPGRKYFRIEARVPQLSRSHLFLRKQGSRYQLSPMGIPIWVGISLAPVGTGFRDVKYFGSKPLSIKNSLGCRIIGRLPRARPTV